MQSAMSFASRNAVQLIWRQKDSEKMKANAAGWL